MSRVAAVPAPSNASPVVASGVLQRKCSCGQSAEPAGECEDCKKRRLQRKRTPMGSSFEVPRSVDDVVRTPGHPLDRDSRAFMESRFEHDFSHVRVHTDAEAATAARAVRAQAFTIGHHVVFGSGHYAPRSGTGQRLIAHELTHVVQQQHGRRADTTGVADDGTAAEREALRNETLLHAPVRLESAARPAAIARKDEPATSVTVEAPTAAPGCTQNQHEKIFPAANRAIEWLDRAITQLSGFIAAPADPRNAAAGQALQRHFHSTDPAIAQRVLDRVTIIRHDIDGARAGTALQVECHTDADQVCTTANAYVSGDQNLLVFCPVFFGWELDARAESIVHEMTHSIAGGPGNIDRAYGSDRLMPLLSTAEALTNPESFGLFVQELGAGRVPPMSAPQDDIERDCRSIEPLIRIAIARGERWNRAGETRVMHADAATIRTHLGDDTPARRQTAFDFYHRATRALKQPFDVKCDKRCGDRLAFGETAADNTGLGAGIGAAVGGTIGLIAGGIAGAFLGAVGAGLGLGLLAGLALGSLIGAGIGAATSHGPRIRICPGWKDQGDETARIETVLRAMYEALGYPSADSLMYARLAGVLSAHFFPTPQLTDIDETMRNARGTP